MKSSSDMVPVRGQKIKQKKIVKRALKKRLQKLSQALKDLFLLNIPQEIWIVLIQSLNQ